MDPRLRLSALIACLVAAGLAGVQAEPGTRQTPALPAILAAGGTYLDRLAPDMDGVLMEEDYLQQAQVQAVTATHLRSDILILGDAEFGWIEFRDTIDVDGKAVADRQLRAAELFSHPSPSALDQARRIVKEGARFNISPVGLPFSRTLNLPLAALTFLRSPNQPRSAFSRDRFENVRGDRTAAVSFAEKAKPRLIGSPDEAAAAGMFWIVPETGQVRRTWLTLESQRGTTVVTASIRVGYAEVPKLGLWLPKTMDEDYRISNGPTRRLLGAVQGRAIYSSFRKFNVTVDDKLR